MVKSRLTDRGSNVGFQSTEDRKAAVSKRGCIRQDDAYSSTKRTTSLNIRAAPSVNRNTEATSLTVVGTDVLNRFHNIISCASSMS